MTFASIYKNNFIKIKMFVENKKILRRWPQDSLAISCFLCSRGHLSGAHGWGISPASDAFYFP